MRLLIANRAMSIFLCGFLFALLSHVVAEKCHLGASDLLSLQLREQASFDARLVEIEGQLHYFKSLANYRAATASDAPVNLLGSNVSK